MKKIPVYLIAGFLGSGKTTFLKNIIEQFAEGQKIAVVQNEFAPANIDSITLGLLDKPFDLMEVNKGSIFCVCLLSDFVSSLHEFIYEHQPEYIFIEATGLADPISIGELLQDQNLKNILYLSKVYTIVDAVNFHKLKNNNRVLNQIRIADEIIINKMDLFNNSINSLEDEIKMLNPYAEIYKTSFCELSRHDLESNASIVPLVMSNKFIEHEEKIGRPNIEAKVLKTTRRFDKKKLLAALDSIGDDIIRLKGYLLTENSTMLAVQFTLGRLEVKEIKTIDGLGVIIAVGKEGAVGEVFRLLSKMTQ